MLTDTAARLPSLLMAFHPKVGSRAALEELSLQQSAQTPSPLHPLFFLWPPLDFEEMNQYLSCKLESTYNSWAMNVQCSYNDLKRQLAVHNAYAGTYSSFYVE